MLHFFLGKVQLAKWYVPYEDEEKSKLSAKIHCLVNVRLAKFTNFTEYHKHKLINQHYTGLYFCVCVDPDDNKLAALKAIHLIMELLDSYFDHNVCELHLVFNFHCVYAILDKVIVGGEVIKTSRTKILQCVEELEDLP